MIDIGTHVLGGLGVPEEGLEDDGEVVLVVLAAVDEGGRVGAVLGVILLQQLVVPSLRRARAHNAGRAETEKSVYLGA